MKQLKNIASITYQKNIFPDDIHQETDNKYPLSSKERIGMVWVNCRALNSNNSFKKNCII